MNRLFLGIFTVLVLAAACTAPNPRSCLDGTCTDPAFPFCDVDGTFQDFPQTCIAVSCNSGEFVSCRGNNALHCNGAGNNYETTACEQGCIDAAGGCVSCVDSSQCANPTPYCDPEQNTCAPCSLDEHCASNVCNAEAGQCVDSTDVVYVAAEGTSTGSCTQDAPCSIERGISRLDASLKILKMLPGEFRPSAEVTLDSSADIHGWGATLRSKLAVKGPAHVRVKGLTLRNGASVPAGASCYKENTQGSLELDRVSIHSSSKALEVFGCKLTVKRSRIEVSGAFAIHSIEDTDTEIVVDRTLLESIDAQGCTQCGIYKGSRSLLVTNSVFRNIPEPISHQFGTGGEIHHSTFVESPIKCDNFSTSTYSNNIMYTSSGGATLEATESRCRFERNLASPGTVFPPNGSVNLFGDPKFVDIQGADYRLQSNSPAIDAAHSRSFPVINEDFDGVPRPQGARSDIGAFEYVPQNE